MSSDLLGMILRGAFPCEWVQSESTLTGVVGDVRVEVAPSTTREGDLSITFATGRATSYRSVAHADEVPRVIRLLVEDSLVKDPCDTDYGVWLGVDRVLQLLESRADEAQRRLDKALCEVRHAEVISKLANRDLQAFKERHGR